MIRCEVCVSARKERLLYTLLLTCRMYNEWSNLQIRPCKSRTNSRQEGVHWFYENALEFLERQRIEHEMPIDSVAHGRPGIYSQDNDWSLELNTNCQSTQLGRADQKYTGSASSVRPIITEALKPERNTRATRKTTDQSITDRSHEFVEAARTEVGAKLEHHRNAVKVTVPWRPVVSLSAKW